MTRRSPIKRKPHSTEQIIRKLRTVEQLLNQGKSLVDVRRALEVTVSTITVGSSFTGMKATEPKRLKDLEQENIHHMRLLTDAVLVKAMLSSRRTGAAI